MSETAFHVKLATKIHRMQVNCASRHNKNHNIILNNINGKSDLEVATSSFYIKSVKPHLTVVT